MNVDQVSILLALLSFFALGIGLLVTVLLVTGRREVLRPYEDLLLPLALAIALTATLGSLYYSGIQNYRPCRMCWWQRIAMYPIVPILGVGLLRRERAVAWYALPLAVMGLGWSMYHAQLRQWPGDSTTCDIDAPCAAIWVDTFGFVSIPFMAMCGFIAITSLLVASILLNRPAIDAEETQQTLTSPVGQDA